MMSTRFRRPAVAAATVVMLGALIAASAGCDIVTADFKHSETSEWKKTYTLEPGGRVQIDNINGKIEVEPSTGNAVEVTALKTAKGADVTAAKAALERIEIHENASAGSIQIETKVPRGGGWMNMGGTQVAYTVRVPAGAEVKFTTVNGGVEVRGLTGRSDLRTTNGGVIARDVSGTVTASTTNGGVDVDLVKVGEGGATLSCTNGGIKLRLPQDAKASLSARITNGGIEADGVRLEATERSRRRLEGQLNGGGPAIRLEGTNGGIRISSR